ncbi:autophagy-related protein 9A-like [Daphnia pulicaria]|uniref:autophagy-related protein 9A-like n=1 Tax=Daphnia pulicaria TaxID=35523 RepID=UPI001EE9D52D|nr:autophagy-related protein 9A-like [Daphnia pulicaria]
MKNSAGKHSQFLEGEEDNSNETVLIHVVPENKSRWNHIEDLDSFFSRVYFYHQQHGFLCMMLQECFELLQFAFIVGFSSFLLQCVNYKILFRDEFTVNSTSKITLSDVVESPGECVSSFSLTMWICIFIALFCWILRLIGVIYHFFQYSEIRYFYQSALQIGDQDLENLTWHEVQQRVRKAQQEYQMCIHKAELTELDIYHRILRFKNYFVAMVNKSILPLKFKAPLVGETLFLSRGLKYNIEFLLFWGPWAPFDNSWHLREEYKSVNQRRELAKDLSKVIGYIGILNFVLAPLVLLWQLLYAFFNYAEVVKREPGSLGARRWSLYGRLYLRHFNELDHELQARLSRAYRPATHYLSGFSSNLVAIFARNFAFLAGAILAVLVLLTVYDEDVITVEHVLTIMTVLGAVVAGCRVLIPEENIVWCPESLMETILTQVHYLPAEWKDKAHTHEVRLGLSRLFQYKAVYLLEELISPIVTPFILYFGLRPKAQEIVDFLRQFTVEVVGVGDVCSFAQLDLHKHGQAKWHACLSQTSDERRNSFQESLPVVENDIEAEDGKIELSLIHFALTNPEWRPPEAAEEFLTALRSLVQNELIENPLIQRSMLSPNRGIPSIVHSLARSCSLVPTSNETLRSKNYSLIGRGISKHEGPLGSRAIIENSSYIGGCGVNDASYSDSGLEGLAVAEPVAANMALSTLLLRDIQNQYRRSQPVRNTQLGGMPGIRESPDEDINADPVEVASAAFSAAVTSLSSRSRTLNSK